MSTFDDREKGFERKFAHDAEMLFRAEARRNKLLGLWAADKMGKQDAQADAYAREVIAADFEQAGDEDVFRKVRKDFDDSGIEVSDTELRSKMTQLLAKAKAQLLEEH